MDSQLSTSSLCWGRLQSDGQAHLSGSPPPCIGAATPRSVKCPLCREEQCGASSHQGSTRVRCRHTVRKLHNWFWGHSGAGKPSTRPARRWLAHHWVYSCGTVPEKKFLKRSKEVNFHQLPGHLSNARGGRWIDASPSRHPKNSYFLFKELKRRAIHLPTKAGHLAARQESKRNLEFRKHNRQGSQLKKRFHLSSDKRLGVMEEGILHLGETMLKISKMCRRSGGQWWGVG